MPSCFRPSSSVLIPPSSVLHPFLVLLAMIAISAQAHASPPNEPEERTKLIGQPASIEAAPPAIVLTGRRSAQQVVITGRYADGSLRDLTPFAKLRVEDAEIVNLVDSFLRSKKTGATSLVVEAGGQSIKVPVSVQGIEQSTPVSFRHQVIAALNVGGCNAGACHGTPSGKNGFKLSLRGFDPAQDYLQLTRDVLGRRSDRLSPASSLFLQKGMGRVPHEGGARLGSDSVAVDLISAWLAAGMPDDPANLPSLKKIDVLPGSRVLKSPSRWQQLAVTATFADGATRDVTRLTVLSCSDPSIAEVSPNGLVEFKQPGEVAILCRYLEEMRAVRLTYLEAREGFTWNTPSEANFIDKFVFAKLKQMSIPPSGLCSDEEFIRRASLDACGMLPKPEETRTFLADKSPDKRAKLIEALLERPEYADFWALKWADVFRSSRKTIQLKGARGFQQWLRDRLGENTPFDEVVRSVLTASGSSYANPPANYFRISKDPLVLAETTAQLFFGVRMQCAKCHNHPFERWSQDDYYSMAAWFARVKTKKDGAEPPPAKPKDPLGEIVVYSARDGEVTQPRSGKVMAPKFLGGQAPVIPPGRDRREALAEWLTGKDNPFFARSVANRVWFHLNGKGIVDPVDDFRESNPSCNDELLDALAADFIANKFDLKKLVGAIMNSRTYQLSAKPNDLNKDDGKYFSHALTKQLSAEQMLDAVCDVTGVPEKFDGLPLGARAIQLPDSEGNNPFLKAFGQPARELTCECEREGDSNLGQALHLINGPTINEKIRNPGNRLGKLLAAKKPDKDVLDELYLAALARLPSDAERRTAIGHVAGHEDKRRAWEDVLWALVNTREFLFRH
jgi:Protein of unknown function (DUF1553)/Protein of unknown function (DUF1549)